MTTTKDIAACAELSPVEQTELKNIAEEIHYLNRKTAEIAFKIGQGLSRARDIFRHKGGGFREWLQAEFNESRTKAYKYIKFYEKSIDENSSVPPVGHQGEVEGVSQKTLFSLSEESTPDEVVKDAIKRIKAGETVTTTTIKEMIKIQNEIDLENIVAAVNLRFCKAAIETGRDLVDMKERVDSPTFLKWLSAVVGMDEGINVAYLMNAFDSFKDAPDEVLRDMNLNELYMLSGSKYHVLEIPPKPHEPSELKEEDWVQFYADWGVAENERYQFVFPASGIQCTWMLVLFDVGKELLKAQTIIGKKGLNSWIQLALGKSKPQADIMEEFISDFKVELLKTPSGSEETLQTA